VNINLHLLKATGRLDSYTKDIENVFSEAEKTIANVLPVKNVDIVVMDNYIVISLDPTFKNFENVLPIELLDTFAHELHHAARWQAIGYGETLLEAIISEGLADHFAVEITKRADIHPWDNALNAEKIKVLKERASKEYFSKKYNHNTWFFGSRGKGIPKWTAYALGFQVVGEYLKKHPDAKASTLYNLPAEEFIK
jgi:uncharacterized protein YjaZ